MDFLQIGLAVTLLQLTSALNTTTGNSAKPKRTISDQIYTHGETNKPPVVLLWDQTNPMRSSGSETQQQQQRQQDLHAAATTDLRSVARPLALVSVQQPIQVFEQDVQKPIAAQQVLYEFQQTPTNAYSNVHVKQLFEPIDITTGNPLDTSGDSAQFGGTFTQSREPYRQAGFSQQPNNGYSNQNIPYNHRNYPIASGYVSAPSTSESITAPVQHNLFTNHGQNTAAFSYYNPNHGQPYQTQHIAPNNHHKPNNNLGKYLYFNGKIVYRPNQQIHQPAHQQNRQQSQNLALLHNQQKHHLPMINFMNRHYPQWSSASGTKTKLIPSSNSAPVSYNNFKPPSPNQYQTINKPILTPPTKKKEVERDEDEQLEEEDEDEEKSESQTQEDDEELEEDEDEAEQESDDDDDSHNYEQEFEDDQENDKEEEDDDYEKHYQESKRRVKLKHFKDNENDDEENDNDEEATKQHVTYKKKNKYKNQSEKSPKAFDKKYGYKEKYRTTSKYRTPSKKTSKQNKYENPKKHYKKIRYTRGGKPRHEAREEESKLVPIVHKQKIYKERWYTTNVDGSDKDSKFGNNK